MIVNKLEELQVVICFQISIFEPLETTLKYSTSECQRCDLLSN